MKTVQYVNKFYFLTSKKRIPSIQYNLQQSLREIWSQSYQTFIFPVFQILLLSLSVCKKGKICIYEKWSSLSAKNGKILRLGRKKVW